MFFAPSMSEQQNLAIWFFGTLLSVLATCIFCGGMLGFFQRQQLPKA